MDKTNKQGGSFKDITRFEIFQYGIGGVGVNLMYLMVSSYIIYYLTDMAGVSAAAAGTMFLASRVVDALLDPILGAASDRTITRWGRYRPYMIFGSIFAVIIFIMLFTAVNFDTTGKNVYYFLVYCVWSFGYTLIVLPYQSIVSVVTNDIQKRNFMVMAGKLLAVPAGLFAVNIFTFVEKLGGGPQAWQKIAIIASMMIVPSMWICARSARRFDTQKAAEKAMLKSDGQTFSAREQLRAVTTNKALLMLIIAFATNNLADASIKAVQPYYAKYVLQDMKFIANVGNLSIAFMLLGVVTIPFLAKRVPKRSIFIFGTILHLVFPIVLPFIDSASNISLVTALAVSSAVGGLICNIVAFMMLPDCVDFGKKLTGLRSAGLVTSGFTFSLKAGAAIGGTMASYVIGAAGYQANIEQTSTVLWAIILCLSIPCIVSDLASYIAMKLYPINELKEKVLPENEVVAETVTD